MQDGLQNISFDRWLMRIKDVFSIISSLISILVMLVGGIWICFKFIEATNQQTQVINSILQNQIKNERVGR